MFLCNESNRPVVVLEKKEADVKLSVLNGEWKIKWKSKLLLNGECRINLINGGFEIALKLNQPF